MATSRNSKSTGGKKKTTKTSAQSHRRGLAKRTTSQKKTVTPVAKAVAEETKPNTTTPRTKKAAKTTITQAKRLRMIEEAAYFIAEGRGFGDGDSLQDWIEAERQIEALHPSEPKKKATRSRKK